MIKWIDIIRYANKGNLQPDSKVVKSLDQWRQLLTPEQFRITRQQGTEAPFSNDMCTLFEPGNYGCSNCKTPLFDSSEKFESGTGWPSFTQPIKESVIAYHKDTSYGMYRVEVTCNVCDAHLGHVFPDGPQQGEVRYCINGLALEKLGER